MHLEIVDQVLWVVTAEPLLPLMQLNPKVRLLKFLIISSNN